MTDSVLRVLVIDDDADTRSNLCDILEMDNCQVATAGTIAEAFARDDWPTYAAIILDRKLPDGTAEEALPRLRQMAPQAAVLIVTGYSDLQGVVEALRQGAADYIIKPIDPQALRASLLRIAAQRRLALAKERSESAFRALVEAAPSMIVILNSAGRILYFNCFAEELTGYAAEEVLGEDYSALFLPPEHRQAIAEDLQRVWAGTPTRGFENPVLSKDGSLYWMIWNAQVLPDYEGAPAVLAVGQDITSLKLAQERALQAERLAAIGQMVTGLAHESGNALARSQACLEMLSWEVHDRPEALDLIQRIAKAQDHLRLLYEDVRSYASPLKLEREHWNVAIIWRQAWENLAMLRRGREATLKENIDGAALECDVDHFRLEQVFRNILENALAACPDPVQISVQTSETVLDGHSALRIAVRDSGPGLTSEQAKRIFEPFFTTKTKGTGLGMAIAKRIIEAHGGQIGVGNSNGRGAEIVITLPREKP